MTALLVIPSMPAPGERLIERLHSPKCEIHLMAVVPNHFCEVVHKCIVVLRCQVVLVAICVPTAQGPHCCYEVCDQGTLAVADLVIRWVEELCWQCYAPKPIVVQ